MKKLLIAIVLTWFIVAKIQAQSISHIETTKNWYYIYDQDGKKIKPLSTSQGLLVLWLNPSYTLTHNVRRAKSE